MSLACFGVLLGVFSAFDPQKSIRLYQALMRMFHWKVEPLRPQREIRNTRLMGFFMIVLSVTLFFLSLNVTGLQG